MPIPSKQHITLVGGVNSTYSTLYTSGLIQAGDTLTVSGTTDNNGVYTVEEVANTKSTGEGIGSAFKNHTCDVSSGSATVGHDSDARIVAGLSVSGTGIPSNSYIDSITNSTSFVIKNDATGDTATASNTNTTLTFADQDVYFVLKGRTIVDKTFDSDASPILKVESGSTLGDKMIALGSETRQSISVWSNNATSDYTASGNGWSRDAINLTTSGSNSKYIYHFVDGALRICNINETNTGGVKWYGHIQKQQFNSEKGLVFNEWQEHPNTLAPPLNFAGGHSYSYGHSNHAANTSFTHTIDLTSGDATVEHYNNVANSRIVEGLNISGSLSIQAYSVVKSITDADTFEMSRDASASDGEVTATFKGENYFGAFRGVAVPVYSGSDELRLGTDLSANNNDVEIIFEKSDGTNKSNAARGGQVVSFTTGYVAQNGRLGTFPKEFLFCNRESRQASYYTSVSSSRFRRSYGGNPSTNAPFDWADEDGPIFRRGAGFNFGITVGTDEGEYGETGGINYEFYESFVYEGNQESLPVKLNSLSKTPSPFTLDNVESGSSLRVSVYADLAYSARITGGRLYLRREGSDEELVLLADVDLVKGMRTKLDGKHVPWTYEAGYGYHSIGDATGNVKELNLDTYQTINGFSPDLNFLGLGGNQEGYRCSVVANRRAWIANVKLKEASGAVNTYGDRIMYSEIGKFDTFLEHNFIDVSSGDFGNYVAIESYADRILAFKQNLVHVINVASPTPINWYLEDTLKHSGTSHSFSVTKTKDGIAWLSDDGCYFFDGATTKNLLDNKLAVSNKSYNPTANISASGEDWNNWYRGSALVKDCMIGFDPITNSLLIFKSPNDGSTDSHTGWTFDFDSNGWTYHNNIFTDSIYYTNFITDWNNNLTLGVWDGSTSVSYKKFLPVPISKSNQQFVTRDIDFGDPSSIKKIYKVIVTYKSNAALTAPFSYSIDGKQNYSSGDGLGGGAFAGNVADTSGLWDVLTLTPASTISCQSLQIRFKDNGSTSHITEINDISIEYRTLKNKKVT